jgi:dihydrofolate synthase/folylpolyglutamate synthase
MTYQEALRYLASIENLGIKFGLENITKVLSALGRPQDLFPGILISGSNGKGSVAAMLESILRHAGRRTGLYTSPHLTRFEERILVNGRPVAASSFGVGVGRVRDVTRELLDSGRLEAQPTHFETVTAAAFLLLEEARVDVAVLEVGMGGRLDATVLAGPILSVITNVSLEHTRFLGETVADIAVEKAGILAAGGTLLAGESHPEAMNAFHRRAREVQGRLVALDDYAPGGMENHGAGGSFQVRTDHRHHRGLRLGLRGIFQERNALLAVAAADLLDGMGIPVPSAAVRDGLGGAVWPGRFQVMEGDPRVVLDGAHNPAACRALREALEELSPRTTLLFGVLRDKDHGRMLAELLPAAGHVVLTRGISPRFRDPHEMAEEMRAAGREFTITGSIDEGFEKAKEVTPEGGTVCVTGSLYLVGDLMRHLGAEPWPEGRAVRRSLRPSSL